MNGEDQIKPLDLDQQGTMRDHLMLLIDHFSTGEVLAAEFDSDLMDVIGYELHITAKTLKLLVTREFNKNFYRKEVCNAAQPTA